MPVRFQLVAASARSRARLGRVSTPHGEFDTPAFMPVGTRATVKGILPELLARTGAQICLANTYHLLLRPGPDAVAALGGLHRFMRWNAPILTDSGGYQAFSMADLNTLSDEGVTFRSIVDGSSVALSPERAIATQNALGADIIMAFDDCPPAAAGPTPEPADAPETPDPRARRALRRDAVTDPRAHARRLDEACERTIRWLHRCKAAHARPFDQALFGIIQGGTDLPRRARCVDDVCAVDLPGYAIGGVAVGESGDDIRRVVAFTAPRMPPDKPRYLMGVGYERDLLGAVLSGVDMFDCVLPTRNGRNATAFVPAGRLRLRNARFALDHLPIDPACDCSACAGGFSRAYLRHLFMADEMLGPILVTLHNLRHFQRFMADVRATIRTDDWPALVARWPAAADGLKALPAPEQPGLV